MQKQQPELQQFVYLQNQSFTRAQVLFCSKQGLFSFKTVFENILLKAEQV